MSNRKFDIVGTIDSKDAISNLDYRYGPYETKTEALAALPTITVGTQTRTIRKEGRTVLIKTATGLQEEYWFKGGIEDEHLIRKSTRHLGIISSSGNIPSNAIHGDRFVVNIPFSTYEEGIYFYDGDDDTWKPEILVYNANGSDGVPIHLEIIDGWIQWKYQDENSANWRKLIEISSLEGTAGEDGKEVEMAINFAMGEDWIAWRLVGSTTWINLIALNDLKGDPGVDGDNPELRTEGEWTQWKLENEEPTEWKNLFLTPLDGREVLISKEVLFGEEWIAWKYSGDTNWIPLIRVATLQGTPGTDGTDGIDGDHYEFRTQDGWVQIKLDDEPASAWANFFKIPVDGEDGYSPTIGPNNHWYINGVDTGYSAEGPAGADGDEVEMGIRAGWIVWKYENESINDWKLLIEISTLQGPQGDDGTDGREVILSTEIISGIEWIVWRYEGTSGWIPLIQISVLRGTDGIDGIDGIDGYTPTIGSNNNWFINGVDTGYPTRGLPGEDGVEVELDVRGGWIVWKYRTESVADWKNLIQISTLIGPSGDDGANGREVELSLQTISGVEWVAWRYVGTTSWMPLIQISSLRGTDGIDGINGYTPTIGPNSNWFINGVDTGYPSRGLPGVDGTDGDEIELAVQAGWIVWKYEDAPANQWYQLIEITSLTGQTGADGNDGREIELSVQTVSSIEWIVWRYVGAAGWTPLIQLSTLKGADGIDGIDGYTPTIGTNSNWYINGVDTGYPSRGESGDEVELAVQNGWIVWKYEDESASEWKQLLQLTEIVGPAGDDGREVEFSVQLIFGIEWISWRYIGSTSWIPLIPRTALVGEDGRTPEMRFDGISKLQWRYVGDTTWIDLYEFEGGLINDTIGDCLDVNWNTLTNTEKFQMLIDRICGWKQVRRTGARNYIKETNYNPVIHTTQEFSCLPGYTYNSNTGKCEKPASMDESNFSCPTGYLKEWNEEEGKWECTKYVVSTSEQQIDLVIVRDCSGSVAGPGRPEPGGLEGGMYNGVLVNELEQMDLFINKIITEFTPNMASGQVRIALVDFGNIAWLKGMSGSTQIITDAPTSLPPGTNLFLDNPIQLKALNVYKDHYFSEPHATNIHRAFDLTNSILYPLKRPNAIMHIISVVDGKPSSGNDSPSLLEGNPVDPTKKLSRNLVTSGYKDAQGNIYNTYDMVRDEKMGGPLSPEGIEAASFVFFPDATFKNLDMKTDRYLLRKASEVNTPE